MIELKERKLVIVRGLVERYLAATKAMLEGVGLRMSGAERGARETAPKHLRASINLARSDQSALVKLLIDKGVIGDEECQRAMTEAMEAEVERYEKTLSERIGRPIKLG